MADFKELSRLLEEILEQGPAGCGCAVARNGEILFEEYHGVKDLESGEPITADSVYRQYSTTKVAVCTGAMMLLERGKFLLNDPIYEYFPEWKDTMVAQPEEDGSYRVRPAKRPILIRDCFSMAMGIGYGGTDYTHQAAEKVRAQLRANVGEYTLQQEIKAMAEVPLAGCFPEIPGSVKEELFEPLDMKNTGYHYFGDIRERMVTTYLLKEDGSREASPYFQRDELFEPEAKYEGGGAGLFSTVRDYLALTQMLACGGEYQGRKIMGRKTIDLMRCNQLNEQQLKEFRNPYLEGYGYGCGVRTLMDPSAGVNSSVGEFGWTGMLGTYVSIDPAEKLSLVYMHNLFPNREAYIHPRIRNIVYGVL